MRAAVGVVCPWPANTGGSLHFLSSSLTAWKFSSWNLKIHIFQNVWSCTFYILEWWSVENKNRSKEEYVINTEGRARRQSPVETLTGYCKYLLSFIPGNTCKLICDDFHFTKETTEMSFFCPLNALLHREHTFLWCVFFCFIFLWFLSA